MDPRQTQNGSWSGVHPPPSRAWVWVAAIVVLLLGNAVAYRVWRASKAEKAAAELAQKQKAEAEAAARMAEAEASASRNGSGGNSKKGAESEEPAADGALARARRVAGLAALEQGDYARAVKELTNAARLGGAGSDVPELLKIAKELEDRAAKQKREAAAAAEAPKPVVVAKAKPAPEPRRRSAAPKRRSEPAPAPEAEEEVEEEKPGLLLVTSQPAGFVVEINGRRVDLTPARAELPAGMHRVVLIRGTKEVHARFVEVEPGQVASVDVDLTEELAPPAPAPTPVAAAAPATVAGGSTADSASGRQAAQSLTAADRQAIASAGSGAPGPAPANPGARGGAGEVYVTSPAIYGEVFINGRGYGFPPLLAKEVPAGPAVVELKVGGTTRRTMKVEVLANRRLAARIR